MTKNRLLLLNLVSQILLFVIIWKLYGTIHNQFFMFWTNITGIYATLVMKIFFWVYVLGQLLIFFHILRRERKICKLTNKSSNTFITWIAILLIPTMGWLTIANAINTYIILKKSD